MTFDQVLVEALRLVVDRLEYFEYFLAVLPMVVTLFMAWHQSERSAGRCMFHVPAKDVEVPSVEWRVAEILARHRGLEDRIEATISRVQNYPEERPLLAAEWIEVGDDLPEWSGLYQGMESPWMEYWADELSINRQMGELMALTAEKQLDEELEDAWGRVLEETLFNVDAFHEAAKVSRCLVEGSVMSEEERKRLQASLWLYEVVATEEMANNAMYHSTPLYISAQV